MGAADGFAVFGAMLGRREDELEEANLRLDALAVSDPLTGLKNVRYFRARLEEARAAALRSGEHLSLVVRAGGERVIVYPSDRVADGVRVRSGRPPR